MSFSRYSTPHHATIAKSRLPGSFTRLCLGPPQGPVSWFPGHRYLIFWPFTFQDMYRNNICWISYPIHPLKTPLQNTILHYLHIDKFPDNFDILGRLTSIHFQIYIIHLKTIFNHFWTFNLMTQVLGSSSIKVI